MANIQTLLEKNLNISNRFYTIPLEWASAKRFIPTTTKSWKRCLKVKSIISKIIPFSIILQTIYKYAKHGNENDLEIVTTCLVLGMIIPLAFFFHFCQNIAPELASFLNGLIQFEQMYHPKKSKKLSEMKLQDILQILILKLAPLTQLLLPFGVVFGLHWMNPYKASLAGYWLILDSPKENDCWYYKITAAVNKLIVLGINYWTWNFLFTMALFVVVTIHFVCVANLLGNFET